MGPAYGETGLQNKTINNSDTNVIYSELGGYIPKMNMFNYMEII
jgi:hypothetical protein